MNILYTVDYVADLRLVAKQLRECVQQEYLEEVFVAGLVSLSPWLLVKKPNGTFCVTNDFRMYLLWVNETIQSLC